MVNRGFSSTTAMHDAYERISEQESLGQEAIILYLGDHDPSGINMTEDVETRLTLYSGLESHQIEVIRLALNYDQVMLWNPPENPAKTTDSRFKAYAKKFGAHTRRFCQLMPSVRLNMCGRRHLTSAA